MRERVESGPFNVHRDEIIVEERENIRVAHLDRGRRSAGGEVLDAGNLADRNTDAEIDVVKPLIVERLRGIGQAVDGRAVQLEVRREG